MIDLPYIHTGVTQHWLDNCQKITTDPILREVFEYEGFSVSIQANHGAYSWPRNNHGPYTHVELGFPSEPDNLLTPFAEDRENLTETVYGYVHIKIVDTILAAREAAYKLCCGDLDIIVIVDELRSNGSIITDGDNANNWEPFERCVLAKAYIDSPSFRSRR